MFTTFFHELKQAGVPVTLREYLTLMEAMEKDIAGRRVEDFYYLSRAALVKDERNLDKFDRVFGHVFKGLELVEQALARGNSRRVAEETHGEIPHRGGEEADRGDGRPRQASGNAAPAACRAEAAGTRAARNGSAPAAPRRSAPTATIPKASASARTSNRNFRAVKVWDKREFKDLAGDVELGTRNIKIALRRLRKFARTGAPDELDLDGTIKGTAHKGYLDILMRPERHNTIKVLLFFDIGGSMDWHIKATEELFSAARTEFKHMVHLYFHNCLYERVWKENARRWTETTPTWDVLHTYPHDYKVIFVGDAAMWPYEIVAPGGSVEHFNEEAGQVWMERVAATYPSCVWLNPVPEQRMGDHSLDPPDAPASRRPDVSADDRGAGCGDAGVGEVNLLYLVATGNRSQKLRCDISAAPSRTDACGGTSECSNGSILGPSLTTERR